MTQQSVSDGVTTRTTDYDYDPVGNLIQVTLPDGNSISYDYDAAHRLTGLEDQLGNRIDYTLDDMGNRLNEQVSDPQGTLTRTQQKVYDQLSQLDQSIDSENHTTDFDYDANGNLIRTLDANLNPTVQDYDPLDRLEQTTDAKNGITQYSYDAQDNLTQVTDPTNLTTIYDYDELGNLLSVTSPDTGVTTYTYDEAGNRLTQTDARGVTASYSYDVLNRLTDITYPDTSLNVSYTYDQGVNGIGQLTQMSDAEGTTDYVYNAYGDLVEQTRTSQDAVVTSFTYTYNPQGQLISQTYPSGHIVHYSYTQGQLTGLSLEKPDGTTQALVSQIQRLPFGPINTLDFGNGLQLSRSFDQDYKLIAQTLGNVLDDSYGHDPVGNITDWQDLLQTARDQSFSYDELDRLTSATGAYGDLGYGYDAVGNRLNKTEDGVSETYSYETGSHRLQEILGNTTDSRLYDEAGNTLSSLIGGYTYDDQNRMVSFTQGSTVASYGYNGKGERVRKTVNGAITRFRYGPSGTLLGEYDPTGEPLREYVYLEGQPIAQITGYTVPAHLLQSVQTNHVSLNVDLGQHPATPVVIASPLTLNGGEGAVVALSDVQNTQVSVQAKEWDYLDDGHATEDISLLALPPGRYSQADGSVWEIGRLTVSGTRQWQDVSFESEFTATPYLFLTQQSQNDPEVTVVRVRNLSASGFEAALYEQETLNNGHGEETVGYLAIYNPTGSGEAHFYDASFNYQLSQRNFSQTITEGEQQLRLQEEQSRDAETGHATETVDILRIEGHTFAQAVSFVGGDPFALRRVGATSSTVVSGTPGASLAYLHTDHLGAVVKATDEAQAVVWDVDRKPFGERESLVGQVEVLLGFPGQYFDQESNNYYNYFRDYDPATGRYLQSDPIGLDGGINTYAYSLLNPSRYYDPYGLKSCKCQYAAKGIPYIEGIHREYLIWLKAKFECRYWCWVEGEKNNKEIVSMIHTGTAFLYESVDDFLCPYVVWVDDFDPLRGTWAGNTKSIVFDPVSSEYSEFREWAKNKGCTDCETEK